MLKNSRPNFTVDALVDRIRAGARRNAAETSLPIDYGRASGLFSSDSNHLDHVGVTGVELQQPFHPRTDDHYHAGDLLKYHDRAFVQNAYRAILKRGPDVTGFNAFVDDLRRGRLNKIDILARLRYSKEGRAKAVRIDGLFFPASVRLLYGVPVLGYLFNLAVGVARLPKSIRSEQQFQAHVSAQQELIADHSNHVSEALASLSRELRVSLQAISQIHREQVDALIADRHDAGSEAMQHIAETRKDFEELIQARESEIAAGLSRLNTRFEEALRGEEAARESSLGGLSAALQSEQSTRREALQALSNRLDEENSRLRTEAAAEALALEQRLSSSNDSLQKQNELLEARTESLAQELQTEMRKLYQKQQEVRAELVLQGERVARLLDQAGGRIAGESGHQAMQTFIEEAEHSLDAFYYSLEERFRGDRDEVTRRLRVYLPMIEAAAMPVLDVGCGRGEWLELLKSEGHQAVGVDSNRLMVHECRERDLEVVQADLMDHLRSLPDASLGAVTGFHVIEHLPFNVLVAFLDETVRVLKPGGLVIFETPNPQNVLVGTCNFYFDPTHRNPLPGPVMKFLLESRGFNGVETIELNPSDETPVTGDSDLTRRFNQYFYGPMDYAVTGRRS